MEMYDRLKDSEKTTVLGFVLCDHSARGIRLRTAEPESPTTPTNEST
jgi:hypothetical protein